MSGAGLSFAFPPYDIVPAIVAFSALLVLLDLGEANTSRAGLERFLLGTAFGFGAHLMGLWWIGIAFLVDAEQFAVLMPLGVVGLPLILAPFMGLAALFVGLAPPTAAWRALALALGVSVMELLRGVVFTGFPWNGAGVALTPFPLFMQSASAVGVTGLAFVAVVLGTLPVALSERRSLWFGALGGALLGAMAIYGAVRLIDAPPVDATAPLIRVVQPNIPQSEKWEVERRAEIWATLLALSGPSPTTTVAPPNPAVDISPASDGGENPRGGRAPAAVVWPETSIPFLYRTPSVEQFELASVLAPETMLIAGAVEVAGTAAQNTTHNSVIVVAPTGTVTARYDKAHLVPFGEYLPLQGLLAAVGLEALAAGSAQFSSGPGPVTLAPAGIPPFQPLICYEVIFPHVEGALPARWIVNVTNDAWFGDTPGPRQHLRHAQLRAVERGLPVVRAANTGISAVVDAQGRIVNSLPLLERGAFDSTLPPSRVSLYNLWGDLPLFVTWGLVLAALVVARVRKRTEGS
ncbi:MAG: apolipoprotein N-acyltransferase [Pseudomonadota bacterium]